MFGRVERRSRLEFSKETESLRSMVHWCGPCLIRKCWDVCDVDSSGPASISPQPIPSDLLPNHSTAPGGEAPPPPPTPPTGSSTPTQRIAGPKPFQDPEVQKHGTEILRRMLEQEEAELQNLLEEQSPNPSPSLEERIESAKRRASQVRRSSRMWTALDQKLSLTISRLEKVGYRWTPVKETPRAVHHGGVSPADAAGPGSGVLSEDAERPQSRRAVLHLPEPAAGLPATREPM